MCNILNDKDVQDYLLLNDDDDDNDEEEYTTEELENLGLDEEEIILVKEEGWSPYDFEDDEDEDVEDDDYYGEDE
jgi:hypothetical protein